MPAADSSGRTPVRFGAVDFVGSGVNYIFVLSLGGGGGA